MKYKIIIVVILLAASFYAGYSQREVQIETKEVVVEKVITKVDRVTEVVERPDGTKITKTVDKSTSYNERQSDTTISKKPNTKNWLLTGSVSLDKRDPIYTLGVGRRIAWGGYMGVYGRSDGEVGFTLTLSF